MVPWEVWEKGSLAVWPRFKAILFGPPCCLPRMSVSDLVTEVEQALVEGERLDEERLPQGGCEGMDGHFRLCQIQRLMMHLEEGWYEVDVFRPPFSSV